MERNLKIGDIVKTRVWFDRAVHPFDPGTIIPPHEEVRIAKIVEIKDNEIIGEVSDGRVKFYKQQIIETI